MSDQSHPHHPHQHHHDHEDDHHHDHAGHDHPGHDHAPHSHHHPDDRHHHHDHSHSHGHTHGHGHHHHSIVANIRLAFFLNLVFCTIEAIGGYWIGSLSILAGAVHDLGDSLSLGSAWFLERYANRKHDENFNFGYRRFSLLSALIAGVVISSGSVLITYEAIARIWQPHVPSGKPMIAIAVLGLFVNSLAAWRMARGHSMNERVLTWHLIGDIASWAVVLFGGVLISLTGWAWLDPLLAIALAAFVAFNVARHLKDTVYLLLQGRPANFDEALFRKDTLAVGGIDHIDQLAVWSLDGDNSILSARLHLHAIRDPMEIEEVKVKVRAVARRQNAQATLETCLAEEASHNESN